jgi:hypothetical protein
VLVEAPHTHSHANRLSAVNHPTFGRLKVNAEGKPLTQVPPDVGIIQPFDLKKNYAF